MNNYSILWKENVAAGRTTEEEIGENYKQRKQELFKADWKKIIKFFFLFLISENVTRRNVSQPWSGVGTCDVITSLKQITPFGLHH